MNAKKKREAIKTTAAQIVAHWEARIYEGDIPVDWADAATHCWRCAYKRRLQRCHIVPDSLGGADEPSNYVLLCVECHREGPNVPSSEFMWGWIKAARSVSRGMYECYWSCRALAEFEVIYGRSFKPSGSCLDLVPVVMAEASTHFGAVGFNTSTLVWVFAEIERRAAARQKLPQAE